MAKRTKKSADVTPEAPAREVEPVDPFPNVAHLNELLACPICGRPAQWLGKLTTKCCQIFNVCQRLYFDADPERSRLVAKAFLVKYHAATCEGCRLPVETCKQKKINEAIAMCKIGHGGTFGYVSDDFVRDWVADHPCEPRKAQEHED